MAERDRFARERSAATPLRTFQMRRAGRWRSGLRWALVFTVIFALSLDFWWWGGPPAFGPLELPRWIYYFVLLQFVLAAAVHLFGRRHWQAEGDESDAGAP